MELQIDYDLQWKVQNEYEQWFKAITNEIDRKEEVIKKLLPINTDSDGAEVHVNLLAKNIALENALYAGDDLEVKTISEQGVLNKEITDNLDKVLEYDAEDMDFTSIREDIVNSNGLYGVAVTSVFDFDTEENQPVSDVIDALSVIPDPKNWKGSKMRFIGFRRRLPLDYIMDNPHFKNKDQVELAATSDPELLNRDRAFSEANETNVIIDQDGLIDVYEHFTTYKGKKYLTTWVGQISICIRMIEIEPMTQQELKNPRKVSFPFQIHRRKPKYGSFFGISIADEVIQYQDAITKLVNYQLLQARLAALWPDKFVDSNLGINLQDLAEKKAGGRVIPVDKQIGESIGGSFYTDQHPNPSQFPVQMRQELNSLAEDTTGVSSLSFGQSLPGGQTRGEIQILTQNTNVLTKWVANNYLKSIEEYWKDHYRSYVQHMDKKSTKRITYFDKGNAYVKELKRSDFIVDGKIQIKIVSKTQEALKNEQNFNKIVSLLNFYIGNIKEEYALKSLLRNVGRMANIDGFIPETYITKSVDEEIAGQNLLLINRNIEVDWPQPWEDYRTYLEIYKQAFDTPAKFKAIEAYREALIVQWQSQQQPQVQWQQDAQGAAMAMNQVSQQQAQSNPQIQWI